MVFYIVGKRTIFPFFSVSFLNLIVVYLRDTSDIWKPYIEHIEAAIMPLFREGDEGNYAVLALAWSTLQMTLPPEIAMQAYNKKYHIYISYAFQYLPFEQMYEISISKNFMVSLMKLFYFQCVNHI